MLQTRFLDKATMFKKETKSNKLTCCCRRSQPLAAVVFLVEVGAKLLAVVGATLEVSLTAAVTVMHPTVSGTVAVALALVTRS